MGKLILISGRNGSGKSRFAEKLISKTTGFRYYIATMQPQTEENHQRIEKHIVQRAGLDFITLEQPMDIRYAEVTEDSVILLEDVSNLLGNTIFSGNGSPEGVLQDILQLQKKCRLLVAVTIDGLSSEEYKGETAAYINSLNDLNRNLLALADAAAAMVDGHPVWKKGCEEDVV